MVESTNTQKGTGPIVMQTDNFRGTGRRALVVLNWSELEQGPVPVDLAASSPPAAAIGQSLRDAQGALQGGLYAIDYQRGIDDFTAGKSPPVAATVSYNLGRQRALEQDRREAEARTAKTSRDNASRATAYDNLQTARHAAFHAKMDNTDAGTLSLELAWQSLSRWQQVALITMTNSSCSLVRLPQNHTRYGVPQDGGSDLPVTIVSAATIFALIRRDLAAWVGPVDDLRAAAKLTSRGHRLLAEVRAMPLAED